MSSSPRLCQQTSAYAGWLVPTPRRLYTPQLVRCNKPGGFEAAVWLTGNTARFYAVLVRFERLIRRRIARTRSCVPVGRVAVGRDGDLHPENPATLFLAAEDGRPIPRTIGRRPGCQISARQRHIRIVGWIEHLAHDPGAARRRRDRRSLWCRLAVLGRRCLGHNGWGRYLEILVEVGGVSGHDGKQRNGPENEADSARKAGTADGFCTIHEGGLSTLRSP